MPQRLENSPLSSEPAAGWQSISSNRALVLDLIRAAQGIPLFPLERSFQLGEVAALRSAARTRISWPVLFLKAYGQVAASHPQLRQAFIRWPWAHFYQFSQSVGMLTINRQHQESERLCWGRFISPEMQPLVELQAALDAYQTEPVESIFRRQVRLSSCPALVRRLAWWISLNASGWRRARRIGTFGMSSLAGQQTINRFYPTPLTTGLTYGPLDAAGQCLVTMICDHRVLDGALGARALAELEQVLCGSIADELRGLAHQRAAA